jgi:hypothetical protein
MAFLTANSDRRIAFEINRLLQQPLSWRPPSTFRIGANVVPVLSAKQDV